MCKDSPRPPHEIVASSSVARQALGLLSRSDLVFSPHCDPPAKQLVSSVDAATVVSPHVASRATKLADHVEPLSAPANSENSDTNTGRGKGVEAGTLTDVCYKDNVAEVDLITLVEEQLPKYVLRADTLTDFGGYDHSDWIQTPVLPDDVALDLSPELIEETLKYFKEPHHYECPPQSSPSSSISSSFLCSERLGQMTKTYNDIECVTRLLEEKERDLELAARIGQSLLEKNKALESKNDRLQTELDEALEKLRQVQHDLATKEALLQIYVQDEDSPSPVLEPGALENPLMINLEILKNRVKSLENENLKLSVEQTSLQTETFDLEEKEAFLVNDCVKQLRDANEVIRALQEELSIHSKDDDARQEHIHAITSKLDTMEDQRKAYVIENAELQKHLEAAKHAQRELTLELADFTERYNDVMALLNEAQEDNRNLKRKSRPSVIHQHYGTAPFFMPEGSLAMELEKSMFSEDEIPDGYKPKQRRSHNKGVMETAKCVRNAVSRTGSNASLKSLATEDTASNRSSVYLSDADSYISDGGNSDTSGLGRAGVPGSNDLETALRRLSLRKANEINERHFMEDKQRAESVTTCDATSGWTTPDSFMSTGSGSTDFSRTGSFRMPEKLQIVKPLEGSATLHQWQRLSTPHMGALFETRPGVQSKGDDATTSTDAEEIYSLSDYEEDGDPYYSPPNKEGLNSGATYTYTTSRIMHPSDDGSRRESSPHKTSNGKSPMVPPSPSHSGTGTSTFSMSMGLARELNERSLSPRSVTTNPPRFQSLVAETRASHQSSHTQQPAYTNASMFVPPLKGINAGSEPMRYRPENAYLNLVGKIKDIGLNSILNIASSSNLLPLTTQDPVDCGLNSVMFMKRRNLKPRHAWLKASQGDKTLTAITTLTTNSKPERQKQRPSTANLELDLSKLSPVVSVRSDRNVSGQYATLPAYMCPIPGSAALIQGSSYQQSVLTSTPHTTMYGNGTSGHGGGSSGSGGSGTVSASSSTVSTRGSMLSVPSLAELKKSPMLSRKALDSIIEKPLAEGIATRIGVAAGLTSTPKLSTTRRGKKS